MSDFVAVFSKAGRAREQLSAEQGQLIGSLNYSGLKTRADSLL